MSDTLTFTYEGETLRFGATASDDHLLGVMRRIGTFYEHDVLERIRERLRASGRTGAALDAGGFIGTHSVFFAKFCGTRPVLTFEANPRNFEVLRENLAANRVGDAVVAAQRALGSVAGEAHLVPGPPGNSGMTRVVEGAGPGESLTLTTIDAEVERAALADVALVKIDVEGSELEVLRGAARVLAKHRPLLCIEVHDADHLAAVIARVASGGYWIVDCLGYSPTYVLEAVGASQARRAVVNALWLRRAALPESWQRARAALRRVAQLVSGRTWTPPPAPRGGPERRNDPR